MKFKGLTGLTIAFTLWTSIIADREAVSTEHAAFLTHLGLGNHHKQSSNNEKDLHDDSVMSAGLMNQLV
jgi:hypothetical protein